MTEKKRGRRGAADKAVARPVLAFAKRIQPPPDDMPDEQAAVWRHIMGSHAGDMITADCYPILAEYCRAVIESRKVGAELDRFRVEWAQDKEGLARWKTLQGMYEQAARLVASLATKLRLTVQARTHPMTAGRHVIDQPDTDRVLPWNFTGE